MVEVDLRAGQVAEIVWKLKGANLNKEEKGRAEDLKEQIAESNLREARMTSADLESAELQAANFENANLSKVNLNRAKLGGAMLKGANLSEANLSEADLQSACLDDSNMRGVVLNATNLQHTSTNNVVVPESLSHLDDNVRNRMVRHHKWIRTNGKEGRPANLEGSDLAGVNLRGVNLSGMSIKASNLESCNFNDTICLFTFFQESKLSNASFRNADLDAANFHHCVLKDADFRGAKLRPIETASDDPNVKAKRWRPNFSGAILSGSDFSGAYVSGAYFRAADLTDVKVQKTVFIGCEFDDGVEDDLKKGGALFEAPKPERAEQK